MTGFLQFSGLWPRPHERYARSWQASRSFPVSTIIAWWLLAEAAQG